MLITAEASLTCVTHIFSHILILYELLVDIFTWSSNKLMPSFESNRRNLYTALVLALLIFLVIPLFLLVNNGIPFTGSGLHQMNQGFVSRKNKHFSLLVSDSAKMKMETEFLLD